VLLPLVIAQEPPDCEILVVDYGCPGKCSEIPVLQEECVAVHVTDNVAEYNRSRARNIGARVASDLLPCEYLVFLDCDAVVGPSFVRDMVAPLAAGQAAITTPLWDAARDPTERGVGVCAVRRTTWEATRGYDESMRGWGYEDEDFWNRCQAVPPCHAMRVTCDITMQKHSNSQRVAYHQAKDIWKSKQQNISHARSRDTVNPLGFGMTDKVEVLCCAGRS
jgi:cellulose synthase/poly-beta-1,6-N-acetylglucosamine synthase-like glycosyltransferase